MSANGPTKKGLTYGRLILITIGLILLIVGYALWRQSRLGPQLGFDEIPFSLVQSAKYVETQVDSDALRRLKGITPKINGTVLFVRTNAGNYAKLAVELTRCLIDPQNLKFLIHRGVVYSPEGQVVQRLDSACVDLSARFDLDSGQVEGQGAPEGAADLFFVERGPALQLVRAMPRAFLALPSAQALRLP